MMDFRKELNIPNYKDQLNIKDPVFLVGSCFTEHMGDKLRHSGFKVEINPSGILFNPISITEAITDYISNKKFQEKDVFFHDEWWMSWKHHSKFIHKERDAIIQNLNLATSQAHLYLLKSDWLILTLGSAWIYQLDNGEVVANCHKVPNDKFKKRLLDIDELNHVLDIMIQKLQLFNPRLKIIFTISPVRHLRDGFIENNRSKSVLIHCTHHLVGKYDHIFYFPSYELIIDDLRDYRFYAEDMVHPNYLATEYIWSKFEGSFIDEHSRELMKEIKLIKAAKAHKPFQPDSDSHQKFLKAHLNKTIALAEKYPFLDLRAEIKYFEGVN